MSPPNAGADFRFNLLPTLAPYLYGGIVAFVALCLIGGWAGESWPLVLGIVFFQVVGSALSEILTRRWKNVVLLRYTVGLCNCIAGTAVVLIVGGYPSPFWLSFLFGSVATGVMLDQIGLYLNTAFAALALTAPRLIIGIDLPTATGIAMQLLILLVVGLVVQKSTALLYNSQRKHQEAEESLRQSNDRLASSLAQLEERTREIGLLTGMGGMLQSCTTVEETYDVIGSYIQQLFPSETGALFIYSSSRNELEAVVTWGNFPTESDARIFTPDECWALRHGQIFQQDDAHSGLHCRHLKHFTAVRYLCVPMMARGEALGVLHMQLPMDQSTVALTAHTRTIETLSSLSASAAEYIALALANQMLRDTLRNQSIRDPLTGLFNRRYAEETLEREILGAARKQISMAVMMLDIDHFKSLNDAYGHDAGDAVLQNLGAFMRSQIRGGDVVCRYGGEEFLIILSDASLENAQLRAEALREGVKSLSIKYRGQPLGSITLSLGISAYPIVATSRETLIRTADAALYRAKTSGRDRVVVAEQAENEDLRQLT